MDTDVRELFDRLVADPPASSVNVDAAIRAGRRQHARRRQVQVGTAAAAVLAAVATYSALTGGNQSESDRPGPIASVAPSNLPDKVEVTCSADGIQVSANEIRTRPAGVVMVVSSSMPKGSYLSYLPEAVAGDSQYTGGEELPSTPTEWTRELLPGKFVLSCDKAGSMDSVGKATVLVSDPDHNWRGTKAIEDLGCRGCAVADWISALFQRGATPAEAVRAVVEAFGTLDDNRTAQLTESLAAVGYLSDPRQTWLVRRNGEPYVTVLVYPEGDHYYAGPDDPCRG